MTATLRAHSQTGEKTRSTLVPVIGLRSSFTRSVNANAAAEFHGTSSGFELAEPFVLVRSLEIR